MHCYKFAFQWVFLKDHIDLKVSFLSIKKTRKVNIFEERLRLRTRLIWFSLALSDLLLFTISFTEFFYREIHKEFQPFTHTKISRLLYTFDFFSPKCVTALRKAETRLFYFDVCLYGASTCHPVRTQHGSSRVCYCLPSRRPANCPPSSRPPLASSQIKAKRTTPPASCHSLGDPCALPEHMPLKRSAESS